ncbi:transcriptional regulator (MarR family) [Halorhodospira halophila SL1]|uniref:Transcriptional regulator (MarR family) n=1 Tax=Halorhodospira halophila (strain DSM 244 / SL1) TaxID=349124 RepID=A1WV22_HALHL|nr:transcriptional regulator (MarR family) [Halorhodospira halophila SL1]
MIERGWVKLENFRRSGHKMGYAYKLTPSGLQERTRLAYEHLQRKRAEHERLMAEIEQLRAEVEEAEAELAERPAQPS